MLKMSNPITRENSPSSIANLTVGGTLVEPPNQAFTVFFLETRNQFKERVRDGKEKIDIALTGRADLSIFGPHKN